MDQKIGTLLLILLAFKGFPKITTNPLNSSNYDISEILRSSIDGLLKTAEKNTTEKITQFQDMYPFNSSYHLKHGNTTLIFNMTESVNYLLATPTMNCNFIKHEMLIAIPRYARYESGTLTSLHNSEQYGTVAYFSPTLLNISIGMSRSPKNTSNEIFWIDLPADFEIKHSNIHLYEASPNPINSDEKSILKNSLESIFLEHMYDKLVEYAKQISDDLRQNTRTIFTSYHPDFFNHPEQFFYPISNITHECFNLTNIIIRGLTNFVSFDKTDEKIDNFGTTLLIENIRGEMILEYGPKIENSIEIIFSADQLFIRANLRNCRGNVEIQNYRLNRARPNISLSDQQSAIIIPHIESAIASSLMPSMKTNIPTITSPRIENLFNELNRFNEEQTTAINKNPNLNNGTNRPKYEYHISFQNVTIKLIPGDSDPKEIRCEFPNNLRVIQEITAMPVRKVGRNSNKGDEIDLKFHVNFTSISFIQIKPNASNSSLNGACEFQLNNNEHTEVNLAPVKNTNETDLMLKKKIDATLISTTKELFERKIKPIICTTLEICNQTLKAVDDFILQLIDKVLKKCSLRRSKINIERN